MKIALLTVFIVCSMTLLIPSTPCKCSSLLNQADCSRQYTAYGCVWSTSSSTCSPAVCSTYTTPTFCNAAGNCWFSSKGVCAAFTGSCSDYNSTSAGSCSITCANGANTAAAGCFQICQNGPTVNSDNSTTCMAASLQFPPACSSLTAAQCTGNALCQLLTNGTCGDLTCAQQTAANCAFSTNTATKSANACYLNGTVCQDATNFTQFNSATCNTNSNDTYTWSPSSSACQVCSAAVRLVIFIFIYALV